MTPRHKTAPAPKPAPRKAKRVKKAKSEPCVIEHRVFGKCAVLGVFLSDSGSAVADVDVAGARRTLSLDPQFWLTPVSDLLAAMPPQSRPVSKEKLVPVREAEPDEPEVVVELALNVDGHLGDGEPPADEDEEEEHEAELVSAE